MNENTMNQITIVQVAGELVVDSRLVAEQLGIKHKTFIANIRSHKVTIENSFGVLRFETAKPLENNLGGRPEVFVWLNEAQSTFVMTLSRNTSQVIKCKVGLVKAFQDQKRRLEDPADRTLMNDFVGRIREIEEKNNLGQELNNPWDLTDEQAGQVFAMAFPGMSCDEETQPPTLAAIAEVIELVMTQANVSRKVIAMTTAEAIAQAYPELSATMSIAQKYLQL